MCKKITIPLILLAAVVLASCDNRSDNWANTNYFANFKITSANITPSENENEYTDTVKKGYSSIYTYSFELEKDCSVDVSVNNSSDKIEHNTDNNTFTYTGTKNENVDVTLVLTDPFDKKQTKRLAIYNIDNIPPISDGTAENIAEIDPHEILIDASSSYDADEKYGGKIISYEYEIVDISKNITKSATFKRILEKNGTYNINIRVMDNDSAWSKTKKLEIVLN